jgi:hypothetical protein
VTDYDPKWGRQIANLAGILASAAGKVDMIFMETTVGSPREAAYSNLQGEIEDLRTDVHNVLTGHSVTSVDAEYLAGLEYHRPCHSTPECVEAASCVEYTHSGWSVGLTPVITEQSSSGLLLDLGGDETCQICTPFACDDPDNHLGVPSEYTPLKNAGCHCGADIDGRDCMCFE